MKLTAGLAAIAVAVVPLQAQMIVTRGGGGERRISLGGDQPVFAEAPAEYGVRTWQVGQWSRYSISIALGQMPLTSFRQVSVVGRQGDRFWVETQDEMPQAGGAPNMQKMLIPFGVVRAGVGTDVIVMGPDSSITRRTLLRAGPERGPAGIGFPAGWTRVGEESLTVVGGTFQAVHYRRGGDNLWISAEAGPLGVVKFESSDTVVELTGKGDGARSRIPWGG